MMFCPTCHDPNPVDAEICHTCGANVPDRQRVHIGQQFVLLDADIDHPIAVRLGEGQPLTVSKPTIISRHRHAVAFGDTQGVAGGRRGISRRQQPIYHFPLPDQPSLDAPRLDLTAVVTERRVYHPNDEVHIFIVAPDHPNGDVELEVRLADQQIMRERVTLNASGLALSPYADLEEGEYTVRVRRTGRNEWAECHFSVVEFTLSPLIATLETHTFAEGTLRCRLSVQQLSVPYTGSVTVGLQCAACDDRVVQTQELEVQEGVVASEFDLSGHDGPFKLQVTTPLGETAVIDLPGSGVRERERIVINPLGRVAEASLLPGDDSQLVRGLHVGYGDVNAAPLRLESAVASVACFTAASAFTAVQIVAHNPLSGESSIHEWQDVARGATLTAQVNAPFTLFTVAVVTSGDPASRRQPELGEGELTRVGLHESWTTVIRPLDLEATLMAPDQAAPGDQITVRLRAGASPRLPSTVHCLLLAYDARLEHESPLPKLGQRQHQAIRDASAELGDGRAPNGTQLAPPVLYSGIPLGAPQPKGALRALAATATFRVTTAFGPPQVKGARVRPIVSKAEAARAPALLMPPTREDFPELAYLELFEFEGQAERVIPLGDQIGLWRCRAYLISGLDVVELTADVQTDKPLYAELDLPAIIAEGDELEVGVTYHSDGPAEMIITLPSGQAIQGMVMGHGTERFKLTGPGPVSVQLSSDAGRDWITRTVKAPGVQRVTASRLELLRANETITGQRVVVYPGLDLVLTDTIEALLCYPFG